MIDDNDINNSQSLSPEVDKAWGTKINVGGTTYATSLFWQPLQNHEDPFAEVEEASEGVLEGADLFCIKQGKTSQFGICVSHEGYKNKEYVAAVSLASALSNISSFVAIFKVSNGWWYTCVRNDIILSDGDMLFLNENEAKEQFMSMLAVPDWGYKIAPASWGIEETTYFDLEDLFQKGVASRLQKIKALRGSKLLAVIGISSVIALWLLFNIVDAILTPTAKPIIAPIAPKVTQIEAPPPEIKPWEKISNPKIIMEDCLKSVHSLMNVSPPGWLISQIACSSNGASTSWNRDVGRISWIEKALDRSSINFSSRQVSDDGNNMIVTVPFIGINEISSPPLKSDSDLKKTLNNMFQSIGQEISLNSFSYVSEQKNTYKSVIFNFASRNNPVVWGNLLTEFSGLEINIIKYDTTTEIWEYEGAIYAL